MRVTVLAENTAASENLICEHGLSLYIETGDKKILFDMGQTDAFARNARILGIDLAQVDFAVLSHGHYDHSGGLGHFLEINPTAPVYLSPHAFGPHYNAAKKYIGMDPALAGSGRLVFVDTETEIAPGITLHPGFSPRFPMETWGLCRLEGGQFLPEDFRHEQYLMITGKDRSICVTGCSHRGILNIMDRFRPQVLIGGFHFVKLDPDAPALSAAARELAKYPAVYYTGHCTGTEQFARMQAILADRLHPISTGITFTI